MSAEGVLDTKPGGWLRDSGHRVVARNALALTGAYVLPRGALFVSTVVAARVLGGTSFGTYSTAGALAVILSIIATAGMQPLLVREMSTRPGSAAALLVAAHRAKLVTGVLMLVSALAVALLLGYPRALVLATLTLALAYAIGSFCENYGAWFQARERMHVWMQATTIFGVIASTAGICAMLWTRDIMALCAAQVIGQAGALAWLVRARRRDTAFAHGDTTLSAPALLRAAIPFAAAFLALTIFYKVDMLLLQRMRGSADAGIYGAAYRLVDAVVALALAGIGAVYPRLARRSHSPSYANRTVLALTGVALVAALCAAVLSPVIISVLFGPAYHESAVVLALLAASFPALACNLLAGYLLAAEKAVSVMAGTYAAGVLLKVAVLAAVIPTFGAAGAAAAMMLCEVVMCAAFLTVLYRRGSITQPMSVLLLAAAPVAVVLLMRPFT